MLRLRRWQLLRRRLLRRGGDCRGHAYDYAPGGYYAYDQGANAPGMMQPQQDYQAFYAGPDDRDRDMPARLQVFLPPQARLTIDGTRTEQTGSSREFETPSLRAGKNFVYTLRAEVPGPDGQPQTITKKVNLRSGMVTRTVMDMRAVRNDRDGDNRREERRPEESGRRRNGTPARAPEDVKPSKEKERKDIRGRQTPKERKDNLQECGEASARGACSPPCSFSSRPGPPRSNYFAKNAQSSPISSPQPYDRIVKAPNTTYNPSGM